TMCRTVSIAPVSCHRNIEAAGTQLIGSFARGVWALGGSRYQGAGNAGNSAACGGLGSIPDHRTRRGLLYLSNSCASPCRPAMLVTHDPERSCRHPFDHLVGQAASAES